MNERQSTQHRRRLPKPITEQRLRNIALYYLERYASSTANLRRVLMRRVERSTRLHGTDREEGGRMVEVLLQRFRNSGLLNDPLYAQGRTASLFRQGYSLRAIRARLLEKGVATEDIDCAVADLCTEQGRDEQDVDRAAAVTYAHRRRLGPFRRYNRENYRLKDMAAMARRGFNLDTVRWVVEVENPEALIEDR